MDGFGKVELLTEGYLRKGGLNQDSQIAKRPAPPPPMRPAASVSTPPAKATTKG